MIGKHLAVICKNCICCNHHQIFVFVLTKTRNDLKPPEITQKLPETTWNQPCNSIFLLKISYSQVDFVPIFHPKVFIGQKYGLKNWSSPNWLKYGAGVHFYIIISNLMFISPKFLSLTFFGQIWSQNLKLSKLIEIWYRVTLLYAYYDFNPSQKN